MADTSAHSARVVLDSDHGRIPEIQVLGDLVNSNPRFRNFAMRCDSVSERCQVQIDMKLIPVRPCSVPE